MDTINTEKEISSAIKYKFAEKLKNGQLKIAIVGGGLGGITIASRLRKDLPKAQITIFDPDETIKYQPGFTLLATGIYKREDVIFQKKKYIPKRVEWIKENIVKLLPQSNQIQTEKETYDYDYMILATGTVYRFEEYKNLSVDVIHDPNTPVTSVYTLEGAIKANKFLFDAVKNHKKLIFVEPNTPFKCGGANKKVNFLFRDLCKKNGTLENFDTLLCSGSGELLSSPIHSKMIEMLFIEKNMPYKLFHMLDEVDIERKVAIFKKIQHYTENGVEKVQIDRVEEPFDYLFVIPVMAAPDMINEAGLSITQGHVAGYWADVDKFTLQHKRYDNIFAIGDCAGSPKGKTGASIRKQYPVLASNLLAHIHGKELKDKFNGYTACPLLTQFGKAVLVEFDYDGAAPSVPFIGPTEQSWLNWLVKRYFLKSMILKGMLRGRI